MKRNNVSSESDIGIIFGFIGAYLLWMAEAATGTKRMCNEMSGDRFVERGPEIEKMAGVYGNACDTDIPIRVREHACAKTYQIKSSRMPGWWGR